MGGCISTAVIDECKPHVPVSVADASQRLQGCEDSKLQHAHHAPQTTDPPDDTSVLLGGQGLAGTFVTLRAVDRTSSLIVHGDVPIQTEKMAITSPIGTDDSDETPFLMVMITTMIERGNINGNGRSTNTPRRGFSPYETARQAAQCALNTHSGRRIAVGIDTVGFGPHAVTEFCHDLLIPSLSLLVRHAWMGSRDTISVPSVQSRSIPTKEVWHADRDD